MSTPLVSIIIVTYNNAALLRTCLLSLDSLKFPKKQREIIVVDNASTDRTVAMIEQEFPAVHLIKESKNHGFAAGNNIGVSAARGEYIVLLNNDTVVDPEWLQALVRRIQSDRSIGAVNSKSYAASSKMPRIQNAGNLVFKNGYGRDRGAVVTDDHHASYETDNSYFSQACEVSASCGVSMIIRKENFEKFGGFDPLYFAYYEDTDLSLTMRRHGLSVWYEPASTLVHHHASTSGEFSPLFVFHTEKNRLALLMTHFPWSIILQEFARYKLLVLLTGLRCVKHAGLKGEKAGEWRQKATVRIRVLWWILLHAPHFLARRRQLHTSSTITIHQLWNTLY